LFHKHPLSAYAGWRPRSARDWWAAEIAPVTVANIGNTDVVAKRTEAAGIVTGSVLHQMTVFDHLRKYPALAQVRTITITPAAISASPAKYPVESSSPPCTASGSVRHCHIYFWPST
jgi:hypothetical protein